MTAYQQGQSSSDTGGPSGGLSTEPSASPNGSRDSLSPAPSGARDPGGHEGFKRPCDSEPDSNGNTLSSSAQQIPTQTEKDHPVGGAYSEPGASAGSSAGNYSGDHGHTPELTAEEQKETENQRTLQEKTPAQLDSASPVSHPIQIAPQANEVGVVTDAQTNVQGEHRSNIQGNLNLTTNRSTLVEDRGPELKAANLGMRTVYANPFTSKHRQWKADEAPMKSRREELKPHEAATQEDSSPNKDLESRLCDLNSAAAPRQQMDRVKYRKYSLDDEEATDELQDMDHEGLRELEGQIKMMNMVGKPIGKEADFQNRRITRKFSTRNDYGDEGRRTDIKRLPRIK